MQGWRKTMEDQSLLEFKLNEIEELDEKCCIFGVFDGHGGSEIAEYAANHFTKKFIEQVTALKDAENLGGEALSSDEKLAEELGECLRKAFISLDQDIAAHFFAPDGKLKLEWREPKQKDKDKEKPAPAAEAPADASEGAATSGAAETNPAEDGEGLVISGIHSIDLCGTTATVLLMTEEHYIVANAGDTLRARDGRHGGGHHGGSQAEAPARGEANRERGRHGRARPRSRACSPSRAVSATRRARSSRARASRARLFLRRESPRSRVARACWLSLRALSLCAETQDEQGRNP